MSKQYYICRYNDCPNVYALYWVDPNDLVMSTLASADCHYRITRRQAVKLCVAGRLRRKNDPSFACYENDYMLPMDHILPIDYNTYANDWRNDDNLVIGQYIVDYRQNKKVR